MNIPVPDSLNALLCPKRIAFVGVSDRLESAGRAMYSMSKTKRFKGDVYFVNPRIPMIDEFSILNSLDDISEKIDHVVIGTKPQSIPTVMSQAITKGVKAFTIFASTNSLVEIEDYIREQAVAEDLSICGTNCMGFSHDAIGLRVAAFPAPMPKRKGYAGLISQSGSVYGSLLRNDGRLSFTIAISTGNEMVTSTSHYLLWMIKNTHVRVIGIFLESIRNPSMFEFALANAVESNIVVIILRVGKTKKSIEIAKTHTGSIIDDGAGLSAVIRRYGVIEVETANEMAATLALFEQPKRASRDGLVAIHDSGGEAGIMADLANLCGVKLTHIDAETKTKLQKTIT